MLKTRNQICVPSNRKNLKEEEEDSCCVFVCLFVFLLSAFQSLFLAVLLLLCRYMLELRGEYVVQTHRKLSSSRLPVFFSFFQFFSFFLGFPGFSFFLFLNFYSISRIYKLKKSKFTCNLNIKTQKKNRKKKIQFYCPTSINTSLTLKSFA